MSEKYRPENGDRVRVVLEGEVQLRPDGFNIGSVLGNYIIPDAEHVVSVEKIAPPLPTTPGSVIKHRGVASRSWQLQDDGVTWRASNGTAVEVGAFIPFSADYDVLFDAGKVEL